ncbi:hypothetical protein [Desulfosarcina ovata]|uniref:Uncharacterized protein n=1 Tax=Desulfosarcina ovata subsp. ovata TaxID=2752305 RepID=A0A5K8AIY5_9BACT|nr:hypothetical protein [Desulfosarcina ovata]BBO92655.1 hypothetical protein DSCOOX_58350 [Desulfosarcina ovata subsp. ovata]
MRKSTLYLGMTATGAALLLLLIGFHPFQPRQDAAGRLERERELVRGLQLTDIALFTEAPYTRHPSLADRFVPFQNHPLAITQFPSESLLAPPAHLFPGRQIVYPGGAP